MPADQRLTHALSVLVEQTLAATPFQPRALVFAPGRVNLIGEHTDYTGGHVLPMTLPLGTCIAARPRTDGRFTLEALSFGERYQCEDLSVVDQLVPHAPLYAKYALGAFEGAQGADLVVASSLPLGAGLSSSASYLCALLLTRAELEQKETPAPWRTAREAQRIENDVIGLASGILDSAAICLAADDSALHIDCRKMTATPVRLPEEFAVLVADSSASRSLANSAYNARVATCERATQALGGEPLGGLEVAVLDRLPTTFDAEMTRCVRHVVTENCRVHSFIAALKRRDGAATGALLDASHASLSGDYQVSSAPLDALTSLMRQTPGVLGARLCGAGFGGCCVALVKSAAAAAAVEAIDAQWRSSTGNAAKTFVAVAGGPARVLSLAGRD